MACINATETVLPLSRIKTLESPVFVLYTSFTVTIKHYQPVYQCPLGVHSIIYQAGINTTLHFRCVPGTEGSVRLGGTRELVGLGGTEELVALGGTGGLVRHGGTRELVRLGVTSTVGVTVTVVVMIIASGGVISA